MNDEDTNLRISIEQCVAGYLHREGDIYRAVEIMKDIADEHEYHWEELIKTDDE